MENTYNIYDAKAQLSRLIERAAAGEEIVIAKAGKPRAKLEPIAKRAEPRKPGRLKGRFTVPDDFDDPLPESVLQSFE